MMTGVAFAQLGGMPIMVITGQKPLKKSKQGRFQVLDIVGMMKPVTKYSTSVVDGARVASTVAHAFLTAASEKP
jgi:acetolactate synthase-1/2/3 large subunit